MNIPNNEREVSVATVETDNKMEVSERVGLTRCSVIYRNGKVEDVSLEWHEATRYASGWVYKPLSFPTKHYVKRSFEDNRMQKLRDLHASIGAVLAHLDNEEFDEGADHD